MARIYVASSRRCERQPVVVGALRVAGHTVYDFRHPFDGDNGFHWSEIDPDWTNWGASSDGVRRFIHGLTHPTAVRGFSLDMAALSVADLGVLVMPCGRSAHLELGWLLGRGKPCAILAQADGFEPELMWKMADLVAVETAAICAWAYQRSGGGFP